MGVNGSAQFIRPENSTCNCQLLMLVLYVEFRSRRMQYKQQISCLIIYYFNYIRRDGISMHIMGLRLA